MLNTAELYLRVFGPMGILYLLFCAFSPSKKVVRVSRTWSRYSLFLRLNSSDILVFKQVFIDEEYSITRSIWKDLENVIDAGANIGLTSVYLAERMPNATFLAVEPDESNFVMLQANTKAYERIHTVRGALWHEDGHVHITQDCSSEWAFRVEGARPQASGMVTAYRVSSLINQLGTKRISLLKLDVEGAEWEILGDADDWIRRVDNIVIELHERIRPGCSDLFKATISDFEITAAGPELVLACRRQ